VTHRELHVAGVGDSSRFVALLQSSSWAWSAFVLELQRDSAAISEEPSGYGVAMNNESSQTPEPATSRSESPPTAGEKTKAAIKDWIAISLSVLALFISLITAYFNLVRQIDDLSTIIEGYPLPGVATDPARLIVSGEISVLFINSGNRPSAISGIGYHVEQWPDSPHDGSESCYINSVSFDTDHQPIVVKQNEIVAAKVRLKRGPYAEAAKLQDEEGGGFSFPVSDENLRSGEYTLTVCLSFVISTPSVGTKPVFLKLQRYVLRNQPGTYFIRVAEGKRSIFRGTQQPEVLLRRFGTIFER
jgi:hypothetical protein